MDGNHKGRYAESLFVTRCIKEDIQIAMPIGNQAGWDLICFIGGKWCRVQIKTAYSKNNKSYQIKAKKNGPRSSKVPYEGYEFDYLVAVDVDSDKMWLLTIDDVKGQINVSLSPKKLLTAIPT